MNNSELNPGDFRITVKVQQYGQKSNYSAHVYKYQVLFEQIPYKNWTGTEPKFEPCNWSEEIVRPFLKVIKYWKFDEENLPSGSQEDYYAPKLSYVKRIVDPETQKFEGLWEFCVTENYND